MARLRIRWFTTIACFALAVPAAAVDERLDLEEVWRVVQAQQAQIDALTEALEATKAELEETDAKVAITGQRLIATADYLEEVQAASASSTNGLSIGGYGELHYNNLNADIGSFDLNEFDFHRFVTFFGYEFNDRWRFFSEVEIEHSLVKDTDDGSNGGEIEIEQAYIEADLDDNHYAKAGLFLLPVGILNETHEPPTFYGVERNDVENVIVPTTWWEAGIGIGGRYRNGLSWDFAVHSGLATPTTGSSAYRVRSGRQKVSHAAGEDLAYSLRLKYTGVPGLELAGTLHHQTDASQAGGDGLDAGTLVELHGIFNRGPFSLRALWAEWNFDGPGIELAGVDEQSGWYVEPSWRVDTDHGDWGFYTRFEDLKGARTRDRFDQWEFGINYWPTDGVVLKFDYRDRQHDLASDTDRDFSGIDLGVGYQF